MARDWKVLPFVFLDNKNVLEAYPFPLPLPINHLSNRCCIKLLKFSYCYVLSGTELDYKRYTYFYEWKQNSEEANNIDRCFLFRKKDYVFCFSYLLLGFIVKMSYHLSNSSWRTFIPQRPKLKSKTNHGST